MSALIIILVVLAAVILWVIALYNGLITAKNRTEESFSDIDVQLKRRYDLIPNLVETVKGYMQHEASTLQKVTEALNLAMSLKENKAATLQEREQAENALSGTLKSLFALSENYPDLKASANFAKLQDELSDTENKIQAARRFYNGNVRDFNTKIQVFPDNIIANMLKFSKYEFFQANETEKENVKISF